MRRITALCLVVSVRVANLTSATAELVVVAAGVGAAGGKRWAIVQATGAASGTATAT
jgi:hypothetical protein